MKQALGSNIHQVFASYLVDGLVDQRGFVPARAHARLAPDANRLVFAVPGSIRNQQAAGPNELIRSGRAGLVTEVSHILEELAPALVWTDPVASRSKDTPA